MSKAYGAAVCGHCKLPVTIAGPSKPWLHEDGSELCHEASA